MKNLLLTLGHNSSAILVEDDKVIWGYETERLTGVKSDSAFPHQILATKFPKGLDVDMVYVSHWEPFGKLGNMKPKHWLPSVFDGVPIRSYDPDFTHHDGHAYAALNFAALPARDARKWNILVVDGFGNYGEHFSFYELDGDQKPKLIERFRGYYTSLGLMYQYATAFMGMKMNEDEYKILGYESKIRQVLSDDAIRIVNGFVRTSTARWFNEVQAPITLKNEDDPIFNLDALQAVKSAHFREFSEVLDEVYGTCNPSSFEGRVIIGYYVQRLLEAIVTRYAFEIKGVQNLIVSGGVFMNVKLNNQLLNQIPGLLCVHPLCGDQGNALGMYYRDNLTFDFPKTLYWGHRSLHMDGHVPGIHRTKHIDAFWDGVGDALGYRGIANVVRGSMEFGPRALCNTSTLAIPTMEKVEFINKVNSRNTIMPMAPVVTREFYHKNFVDAHKLHRSEKFMVCALDYYDHGINAHLGAANRYESETDVWYTGRPQVVERFEDPDLYKLVEDFGGILINTSFNFHGHPICFEMLQVADTHRRNHWLGSDVKTFVLET